MSSPSSMRFFLPMAGGEDAGGQGEQAEGEGPAERDQAALGGGDAEHFLGDADEAAAHVAESHHEEGHPDHQDSNEHGALPSRVAAGRARFGPASPQREMLENEGLTVRRSNHGTYRRSLPGGLRSPGLPRPGAPGGGRPGRPSGRRPGAAGPRAPLARARRRPRGLAGRLQRRRRRGPAGPGARRAGRLAPPPASPLRGPPVRGAAAPHGPAGSGVRPAEQRHRHLRDGPGVGGHGAVPGALALCAGRVRPGQGRRHLHPRRQRRQPHRPAGRAPGASRPTTSGRRATRPPWTSASWSPTRPTTRSAAPPR